MRNKGADMETGTCQSCGRRLTSAASIARGRGPKCSAKVRRAARLVVDLIDAAGYKPHQLVSAVELIEDAAIVPLPVAGAYVAVSTDGHEFYECTAHTCGCPAAEHDRKCYHRLSATILDAA
jgi:hypothetical protein